jgi:hypothetical protein
MVKFVAYNIHIKTMVQSIARSDSPIESVRSFRLGWQYDAESAKQQVSESLTGKRLKGGRAKAVPT